MTETKLISDTSNKSRYILEDIKKVFDKYFFYYHDQYLLENLSHITSAGKNYLEDDNVRDYYVNLDYRLIDYIEYEKTVISSMVEYSNFLVTSFDTKGIMSPLNLFMNENIHPGGKRLLCARYLGMKTMPIVSQTLTPEDGIRLHGVDDIFRIYGNEISINVNADERLEISWHGETHRRDQNGYDDWYTTSAYRDNIFSVCDYLLENGLEVVSNFGHYRETINGKFRTIYTSQPKNDIYIEVFDQQLMSSELDFWELYFHIDPAIGLKICSTSQLRIVNRRASEILHDCSLYKTLTRKKLKFD